MMIRVYPNGFGYGKGTHLSMFSCLQRGEFDDQLWWPFNGEVTVEAYNRSLNQWSKRVEIQLNDNSAVGVACKPKKFRNLEFGFPQFISYKELNDHYLYYREDNEVICEVSIRVIAVKLYM